MKAIDAMTVKELQKELRSTWGCSNKEVRQRKKCLRELVQLKRPQQDGGFECPQDAYVVGGVYGDKGGSNILNGHTMCVGVLLTRVDPSGSVTPVFAPAHPLQFGAFRVGTLKAADVIMHFDWGSDPATKNLSSQRLVRVMLVSLCALSWFVGCILVGWFLAGYSNSMRSRA